MPDLLWYPTTADVEVIIERLSVELFPGYSDTVSGSLAVGGAISGNPLLESALGVIQLDYYPSVIDKAGALLRSMVKNHPFVDGNKRIGILTTMVFLNLNGYRLVADNAEMVRFTVSLAASDPSMDWKDVAAWLRTQTRKLRKRARPSPPAVSPGNEMRRLADRIAEQFRNN